MKYIILFATLLFLTTSCKPKLAPNADTTIPTEVNSTQLNQMLTDGQDMVLLDVRTPEEIAEGKIEGALEIDYFDDSLSTELDKLDKDKHYLVYCKSGGRSAKTIAIMQEKGFKKCTNLEGGYTEWSTSNQN